MEWTFEWDDVNEAKVKAHGLTRDEVESVFEDPNAFRRPADRPSRVRTYGTTSTRKFVCVVWTRAGETIIRPTTAYRTNPRRIQ